MRKYAVDLTTEDKIIDKRTGRVIIIDWLSPTLTGDAVNLMGYFEDDGEDVTRQLDADAAVRIA